MYFLFVIIHFYQLIESFRLKIRRYFSSNRHHLGKIAVIGVLLIPKLVFSQANTTLYYFDPQHTAVKTLYDSKERVVTTQEYSVEQLCSEDGVIGKTIEFKRGRKNDENKCLFLNKGNKLLISMGKNDLGKHAFLDYPLTKGCKLDVWELKFNKASTYLGREVNLSCRISERKILSYEKVVTPLGTWDCIKIGYSMEVKAVGIPLHVYVIEWFCDTIGIVRTDIFRGDKLYEKRVLTCFKPSQPCIE